MTLTQLRMLVAVADRRSVRAAAEQLYVSQPAVSAAIGALERELGVDLLVPAGRGIRLTPAGQSLADAARSSLQTLDRGVRVARSEDDPGRGEVRIASIGTAAEQVLLPLLREFRDRHPRAEVTVEVGNRAAVWQALAAHDVDLVVAGRPPVAAATRILGTAPNTLVVVGRDPMPAGRSRSRRERTAALAESTWLLREEGSGTREATDQLLAEFGIEPRRMILGSNGAVLEAVAAGLGVALLPEESARADIEAGRVVRLECPGAPLERPWHLVQSGRLTLSPTADLAARSLLEQVSGFAPTADGRRLLERAARRSATTPAPGRAGS